MSPREILHMRRTARPISGRSRRFTAVLVTLAVVALPLLVVAGPAQADSYVPISGAGSTWSQNALDQWRRNVNQFGMKVNYQGTGSSDGRNQFRNGTVDFAVSEIPYGLKDGGVLDTPPAREFAYLPIVAGGTSFMYNLKIGGKRVTTLRLSGENLAKIFTGGIKSWADPAIAADNPGLKLPARKVVPVVRSDGSGTTAQLTTWLSKEYPSLWDGYCKKAGRSTPCGTTSQYPVIPGSGFTAQSGSLGVSGYVSQSQSEGTITYVEYSYALNTGFPAVKVLNKAGYYTLPKASNVAVGLLKAVINPDLTQNLLPVYNNTDPRAYPLSSYSYMIVPKVVGGTFSAEKGRTLGDFAYYFLCEGQQQADVLGYSPLPINLVKAGLAQVRLIPGVDVQSIDIKKCNNPTFSTSGANTLAKNAPQPKACDKQGPTQCDTSAVATTASSGGTNTGTNTGTGTGGTGSGTTTGTGGGTTPTSDPSASSAAIDPDTGQPVSDGSTVAGGVVVAAIPVSLSKTSGWSSDQTLMALAGLLLILLIFVPPLVARRLSRADRS
jgi:phosphate ABC transporter phosphate-binding protein